VWSVLIAESEDDSLRFLAVSLYACLEGFVRHWIACGAEDYPLLLIREDSV
jgi:hypothetical protein